MTRLTNCTGHKPGSLLEPLLQHPDGSPRAEEPLEREWRYRLYDSRQTRGPTVHLSVFPVVKRTANGAWIDIYGDRKFVLDGPGKRFAHETFELALQSYEARKERQVRILAAQLEDAEKALAMAKQLKETGRKVNSYEGYRYDEYEDKFSVAPWRAKS
jgi:hypothetical protein